MIDALPEIVTVDMPLHADLERRILAGILDAARGTGISVEVAAWNPNRQQASDHPRIVRHWSSGKASAPSAPRRVHTHIGGSGTGPNWHWFDDVAIGACAAHHLTACQVSGLAYLGNASYPSSVRRSRGVAEVAEAAELPFRDLSRPDDGMPYDYLEDRAFVAEALASLDHGLGLVTYKALVAHSVLEIAETLYLKVPGSLRVVACDDDPLLTTAGSPEISAVDLPAEELGRSAFEGLLATWGHEPATVPEPLPPRGLQLRASSRGDGIADPVVARAQARIAADGGRGLSVVELAADLGLSPRHLRRLFAMAGMPSPAKALLAARLDRAAALLSNTDLPIARLAEACGYESPTRFCNAFRATYGSAPSEWRKKASAV